MQFYPHSKSDFPDPRRISKLPAVYLIRAQKTNFIKIGFSNNLKHRLNNIQIGCPHEINILSVIRTPHPRKVELALHHLFAHCKFRGEWFDPSEQDMDEIIDFFENTNAHIREVRNALLQA